jgi:hypothetical protein
MPYIKPIHIKDASWHIFIDFILLDTFNGLVELPIAMTNFNKYNIQLLHFFPFLFYFLFCCSCDHASYYRVMELDNVKLNFVHEFFQIQNIRIIPLK